MHVYNTCLTDCLDKHTPWRNVRVRDTTPHPWYDTDIDVASDNKREQETVWRRTKLEIHRQLYVAARDECAALISARKTDYRNRLEKENNKNMFRLLRSLDGQRVQLQPEFYLATQGCELLSRFFRGKTDNLLSGRQCFNVIDRPSDERRCFTDCIDVFDPTTNTEITPIYSTTKTRMHFYDYYVIYLLILRNAMLCYAIYCCINFSYLYTYTLYIFIIYLY